MLFGAASVLVVCLIDPLFFSLVEKLNPFWLHLSAIVIVCVFLCDYVASHVLMGIVKKEIDAQEGDNTEEISREIHLLLQNRNVLLRRIEQAYPDLHSQPHWLTVQIRQARKKYKDAERKVSELIRKGEHYKELLEDNKWREQLDIAVENKKNALREFRELQKKKTRKKNDFR